jgi:pantothenate kinase
LCEFFLTTQPLQGAPWTFDGHQFVQDIAAAKSYLHSNAADAASPFSFPGFDHAVGDPVAGTHVLAPDTQVVLVEGNYLLLRTAPWDQLHPLFDIKVFIDLDMATCCARLVKRHMLAWGISQTAAQLRVDTNDAINCEIIRSTSDMGEQGTNNFLRLSL